MLAFNNWTNVVCLVSLNLPYTSVTVVCFEYISSIWTTLIIVTYLDQGEEKCQLFLFRFRLYFSSSPSSLMKRLNIATIGWIITKRKEKQTHVIRPYWCDCRRLLLHILSFIIHKHFPYLLFLLDILHIEDTSIRMNTEKNKKKKRMDCFSVLSIVCVCE